MSYPKMFKLKTIVKKIVFGFVLPLFMALFAFNIIFNNVDKFDIQQKEIQEVNNNEIKIKSNLAPVIKIGMEFSATFQDYRAYVLDRYFAQNRSPLSGYGSDFVAACDKYGAPFDCTTIPAIAYVETGLCTLGISQSQFNCWGWGGSAENRIIFKSYSEAIDKITKGMVNGYGKIMQQPDRIVTTYCGPQCTTWAAGVKNERTKLNNMSKKLNLPALY